MKPPHYIHRSPSMKAKRVAEDYPFEPHGDEEEIEAAVRWLRDLLADGPVYVGDIKLIAAEAGIPLQWIQLAKLQLGVRFEDRNRSPVACWALWFWFLPEADDED